MPTPRNLAAAPSGVNNFGRSEYPNARSEHPNVPTPEVTSIGLHTATKDATGGSGTYGCIACRREPERGGRPNRRSHLVDSAL
jgi:hypothetical protein